MNVVVLNALNTTIYAKKEIYNGKTSLDYAIKAARDIVDASKIVVILPSKSDLKEDFTDLEVIIHDDDSVFSLIDVLTNISKGFDNIFYFFADCALVDTILAKKMYNNHVKYFCEYTFADGYPKGITVEIIKTSILPALAEIAKNENSKINRESIFSLIEKDINSFELETEISPDDQRLLRISLFPNTKRNFIQLKAVAEQVIPNSNKKGFAADILKIIRKQGELLRTLPAFFEFETTSKHNQKIEYFPVQQDELPLQEMSLDNFKVALEKISNFSEDAVISLSIRNEPALHSNLLSLISAVLSYKKLSVLIETSGTGWNKKEVEKILSLDASRITWIIDLDALDPELYNKLRGNGYEEAYSFAKKLIKESPSNTWVQTVRIIENETDNENFYKYWKEITENVIIQKYDWYCGILKQRKITDLSPVKRFPCWHLKRELAILHDGQVPLCREDLKSNTVLGNIFLDDISTIWTNGHNYYKQHLIESYPELCRKCDEYYTFNY